MGLIQSSRNSPEGPLPRFMAAGPSGELPGRRKADPDTRYYLIST